MAAESGDCAAATHCDLSKSPHQQGTIQLTLWQRLARRTLTDRQWNDNHHLKAVNEVNEDKKQETMTQEGDG